MDKQGCVPAIILSDKGFKYYSTMDSRPSNVKCMKRKVCIVPKCISGTRNSDNALNKVFFKVPARKELKEKWKSAVGGFGRPVSEESNIYCCEDHFDLHDDTSNFIDYYMSVNDQGQYGIELKLKSDIIPHKFKCQSLTENNKEMIPKDNMEGNSHIPNNAELQCDGGNNSFQSNKQLNHVNTVTDVTTGTDEEITTALLYENKTLEVKNKHTFSDTNFSSRTFHNEIEISDKGLLAICKPVKIELYDLKYAVNPKIASLHETLCSELQNDPIVISMSCKRKMNSVDTILMKRRKLIPKIFGWEQNQSKYIAIYDRQCKELEMYYLNSNSAITTYKRFFNIEKSTLRHYIYEVEFKGRKNRLKVVDCCCWFYRENFRPSMIGFTKKPHKCDEYNYCSCCCRNIPRISHNIHNQSINTTESTNVWLNEIVTHFRSLIPQDITSFNAIKKALIVTRNVRDKSIRINNQQYDSFAIKINNEYYKIDNGYIVFHMKHRHSVELLNYESDINRNVCCWYKREQLANDLHKRYKVPSSTVKFIRSQHLCPIKQCKCCCKPKHSKKSILSQNCWLLRYTTDATLKNVKIKISFSNVSEVNLSTSQAFDAKSISSSSCTFQSLDTKSTGLNLVASEALHLNSFNDLNSFASQHLNAKSIGLNPSATQFLHAKYIDLNTSVSQAFHAKSSGLTSSASQPLHVKSIGLNSSTDKQTLSNRLNSTLSSIEASETIDLTAMPSAMENSGMSKKYANNIAPNLDSNLRERLKIPFVWNDLINKTATPSQGVSTSIVSKSINTENILDSQNYSVNDSKIEEIDKTASTSVAQLTDNIISNMIKEDYKKNSKSISDRSSKKCKAASASTCRCKASPVVKNKKAKNISSVFVTSPPISMTTATETNSNPICKMTIATPSESIIDYINNKAVMGLSTPTPLLNSNTQDTIKDVSCCTFSHKRRKVSEDVITHSSIDTSPTHVSLAKHSILSDIGASTSYVDEACTFSHKPKKVSEGVITHNSISTSPAHVPSAINGLRSDVRASTSYVDEAITKPVTTAQPKRSMIQILERLKNIRISNGTGGLLSAQLDTPINNLSTTELKILNFIMILMENKLKSAGLTDDNIHFNCDSILEYMTSINDGQKSCAEEIETYIIDLKATLKSSEVFQSSTSINQKGYMNTYI